MLIACCLPASLPTGLLDMLISNIAPMKSIAPHTTPPLPQLRRNALAVVYAIMLRAAPDAASNAEWLEPTAPGTTTPAAATAGARGATAAAAALASSAGLQALPMEPAARQAAVAKVEASLTPVVLMPLERLHAAVYTLRQPWLQQAERDRQQQQGGGGAGAGRDGAGAGAGGRLPPDAQMQAQAQVQGTQGQQLGVGRMQPASAAGINGPGQGKGQGQGQQAIAYGCAVDGTHAAAMVATVLARAYALQLQAGRLTWRGVEERVLAPYPSLQLFWTHCSSSTHRQMVVFLAARLPQDAPSIITSVPWGRPGDLAACGSAAAWRHGGGGGGAPLAAAGGALPEPAVWLLKIWLRAALDSARGANLSEISWSLSQLPATRTLFCRVPLAAVDERGRVEAFNADWTAGAAARKLLEARGEGGGGAGKAGALRGALVEGVMVAMAEDLLWSGRLLEVRTLEGRSGWGVPFPAVLWGS